MPPALALAIVLTELTMYATHPMYAPMSRTSATSGGVSTANAARPPCTRWCSLTISTPLTSTQTQPTYCPMQGTALTTPAPCAYARHAPVSASEPWGLPPSFSSRCAHNAQAHNATTV